MSVEACEGDDEKFVYILGRRKKEEEKGRVRTKREEESQNRFFSLAGCLFEGMSSSVLSS